MQINQITDSNYQHLIKKYSPYLLVRSQLTINFKIFDFKHLASKSSYKNYIFKYTILHTLKRKPDRSDTSLHNYDYISRETNLLNIFSSIINKITYMETLPEPERSRYKICRNIYTIIDNISFILIALAIFYSPYIKLNYVRLSKIMVGYFMYDYLLYKVYTKCEQKLICASFFKIYEGLSHTEIDKKVSELESSRIYYR